MLVQPFLVSSWKPSSPLSFTVHLCVLRGGHQHPVHSWGTCSGPGVVLAAQEITAHYLCLRSYSQVERQRLILSFFFPVLSFPKGPSETLQSAVGMQTMRQGRQRKFSEKINLESTQEFMRHQPGQSMICLMNRK